MRRAFVIAIVAALTAPPALGQTPAPAPLPNDPSLHAFGDTDKTCTAWTDQCRSCTRGTGGEIACSNIGIACQPAAITCTTRQTDPPKPTEPKKEAEPKK
jgi:hypothetical protein